MADANELGRICFNAVMSGMGRTAIWEKQSERDRQVWTSAAAEVQKAAKEEK